MLLTQPLLYTIGQTLAYVFLSTPGTDLIDTTYYVTISQEGDKMFNSPQRQSSNLFPFLAPLY